MTYRDPDDQAGDFFDVVQHDHDNQHAGSTKKLNKPKDQLNLPHLYDPLFGPWAHRPEVLNSAHWWRKGAVSFEEFIVSYHLPKYLMIDI